MTSWMVVPASLLVGLAVIGLGSLVSSLWAIIDAVSTPKATFVAAGTSKGRWIAMIAVLYFFTVVVGMTLAIVYLTAVRPRLREATVSHQDISPRPASGTNGLRLPDPPGPEGQ